MTRSFRAPARALAALAAATTVGAMLPLITGSVTPAAAASSCLAPTSLSPDAGAAGVSPELKDVVVSWKAPSDAVLGTTTYDLQFSPDQDYATNLTYSTTTSSTKFEVPLLALSHGSYFWRVRVTGRSCWSDDTGNSAEFTRGWRDNPTLSYPANGATVALPNERYSWSPVAGASSYLLQVQVDDGGSASYSCVTQATTFSPYDISAGQKQALEKERVTANDACTIPSLPDGTYNWRVQALDDTALADNTKPYGFEINTPFYPEDVTAHDANLLKKITNAEIGAPSDQHTFTVGGTVATAPAMSVSIDQSVNADGTFSRPCDTLTGNYYCGTTPTISWTPVDNATSYRVIIATDPHFSAVVRVMDTASDSVTEIDQLLDSQAGQAYYVSVCSDTRVCSASANDSTQTSATTAQTPSFRKLTLGIDLASLSPGATTAYATVPAQVTLSWGDRVAREPGNGEAADYEVQVASTCDYANATTYTTDMTELTDLFGSGDHYWRVRPVDASGSPGPWTEGNASTPVCSASARSFFVPSPGTTGGVSGGLTVQTSDKSVKKSGAWVSRVARGANGGTALVTAGNKKQALTYTFTRGSYTVGYCVGPMDGYFSVILDGKAVRQINTHAAFTSCGKTFTVKHLKASKSHKLVVQASDKKGFAKGSTQVVIDYFKVA